MMEVRCCCTPENLIGYLPAGASLRARDLNDGTQAYSSDDWDFNDIRALPGFVPPPGGNICLGKKTWKKTWRGK